MELQPYLSLDPGAHLVGFVPWIYSHSNSKNRRILGRKKPGYPRATKVEGVAVAAENVQDLNKLAWKRFHGGFPNPG